MPAHQATASYEHRVPACCRLQAFMRGLEADPRSSMLQDALDEVSRTLTLEQVSQVSLFAHGISHHCRCTLSRCWTILQAYGTAACEQARDELLRSGCIGSTSAPAGAGGCTAANYRLEIILQFSEVHPANVVQAKDAGRAVLVTFACTACSSLHAACRRPQLH